MSETLPDQSSTPKPTALPSTRCTTPEPSEAIRTPTGSASNPNSPPLLSRQHSHTESNSNHDDWEAYQPLEPLTVFDMLDNFALPTQLEKIHRTISEQTKKPRETLKLRSLGVVEEWRKRLPPAEEQLDRYRKMMRENVDRLGRRWNDTKAVTLREKTSFISGVMNVFVSGYMIGAFPQYFHWWYTMQLLYFMPVRYYTYRNRGYHYFLADLCYFVNFLCLLSIWVFPSSKRLFISTFCLAFGNNAIAIAMWRNSMVFHSLDKVTSLFIHIMPCVTLHCIIHCIHPSVQQERFPAIWTIRKSLPGSRTYYSLLDMTLWSTLPYAVWQLFYHVLITVRRREKIAAGRPTSFTYLRKSYAKSQIGQMVLSLPNYLQEPAFMLLQYAYALLTMLPCPIWFWYRAPSAAFLLTVFAWSVYNGATYYIDVFGKRFQHELETMRKEVQKWQVSPEALAAQSLDTGEKGRESDDGVGKSPQEGASVEKIPLLNDNGASNTVLDGGGDDIMIERKAS